MVSRSEQVVYGLIGLVFLTTYQFLVQPWLLSMLPNAGYAEALVFNVIVWALSYVFVLVLIRRIRQRGKDQR